MRRHKVKEMGFDLGIAEGSKRCELVSKMERRSDMYISTLSKIIEAMGGELQIVAKMPNGNVKIRQFTQIREDESETASAIR